MNKALKLETLFSFSIIVLAVVLANPFNLWMPTTLHMMLIAVLLIFFTMTAFLVLQRTPLDEREQLLSLQAYKTAYVVSTTLVVMGIVLQSLNHVVDPWLVMIFIGLVATKVVTLAVASIRN